MKDEKRFYVYVYLDPRKPGKYKYGEYEFEYEPFYVGKGCGKRWRYHLNEAKNRNENNYKLNKIRKIINDCGIEPIIIKYKENLDENVSLNLEVDMVDKIGRIINNNEGPLVNITDGGEKFSGLKNDLNGRWKDVDKNLIFGLYENGKSIEEIALITKTTIPLIRRRIIYWELPIRKDINIGRKKSIKCKEKISKSKIGLYGELNANHKYVYTFVSPDNHKYKFKDINKFCKEYNLNYGSIRKSFKRNSEYYKDWKIERRLILK